MRGIILAALAASALAGCVAVPAYHEPAVAYYPAPAVGVYYRHHSHHHHGHHYGHHHRHHHHHWR